jgi:GT2 family glycosyltransferase
VTDWPDVSVVIPTFRRRALVEQALDALRSQTLPADRFEVVVSIDGSEDGTREMVSGLRPPYRLVPLWQPNRGRAAACNAGARAAQGDLLVLLDDDMEASPGLLDAHRRAHAAPGGRGLAVLGAAPMRVDGSSPPAQRYVAAKFNGHMERLGDPRHRFVLRDVYTGNFSVPRRAFLEVGGFDEAFRIYGNEDLELSIRLQRAGLELAFAPDAFAHQHYTKTFVDLARDTVAKGRTAVLLAGMHPDALPQLHLGARRAGSLKWRLLRSGLLGLSAAWPGAPDAVIRMVERAERRSPSRLDAIYRFALDYLYWLGVRAALRENARSGTGLARLG